MNTDVVTYIERSFSIPFVPDEIRLIMTSGVGYAGALDQHGVRTALIAKRIGERLELGSADLAVLVSAAYLHDFGKMFIPVEILNKPAALNADEYRRIQEHPETARKCLAAFDGYERIAIVVGQHHERMDGRGYPHRRPGVSIDPLARILSVADAFTAMTEDRPYQGALARIAAIERIRRSAGPQFDIDVVEAFLESNLDLSDLCNIDVIRGERLRSGSAA
jgi:HD-GYP domain-containing protein (c-di-GMP phosphodiesterase class II)